MTCKDCIHSGLCYKENQYENFPERCGSFIRPASETYTFEQVQELVKLNKQLTQKIEKGKIYKRGFEDGYKQAIDKLKDDIFSKSNNMEDSWDTAGILNLINKNFISFITGGEKE